jgi:single-strand DNA-binding protein
MNKAFLMGRLTKDPELRMTATGTPVATFSLAVDRPFVRQGEERKADFFNIVAWRNTAEFCKKYLTKGSQIIVIGTIQNRSWDDQNGQRRYITEIIADSIEFAGSKRSDAPAQGTQAPAPSAPAPAPDSGSGFYPIEDDAEIPF